MALDCRLPLLPPIDFGPSSWTTTWSTVLLSFISGRPFVRPFVRCSEVLEQLPGSACHPFLFSLSLRFRSWELGTRFRFRIQVAPFHLVFAVVVVVVLTSITFE